MLSFVLLCQMFSLGAEAWGFVINHFMPTYAWATQSEGHRDSIMGSTWYIHTPTRAYFKFDNDLNLFQLGFLALDVLQRFSTRITDCIWNHLVHA